MENDFSQIYAFDMVSKTNSGRYIKELVEVYDELEVMGDEIIKRRKEMHKAAEARGEKMEQVCLLDTMMFLEASATRPRLTLHSLVHSLDLNRRA